MTVTKSDYLCSLPYVLHYSSFLKKTGLSDFIVGGIYPPEDKTLLEKYENLLAVTFQTFLSGRAASFQRELE